MDRRAQRAGAQLRVSRRAAGRHAAGARSCRGGARVPGRGGLQREVRDARPALLLDRAGRPRPLRHRVVRRAGVGPVLRLRRAAAARGRARARPRPVARGAAARPAEPLLQRLAPRGSRYLGRGPSGADTAVRPAERRPQPRGRRDRTRAHRYRLAVADRGDVPQVRPHVQLADRVHGRLSRVPVRLLPGAAVRLDQAAQPRSVRADQAARRARPVHPRGRDLGRAGLQHPLRRVARPAVPARAVVLRARVRQALPRVLEPGRLRVQRAAASDHARGGHRAVPHPEALLEPVQQAGVPLVPVAGHRREPRLDAFPSGRHLQRDRHRGGDPPDGTRLQGARPLAHELPAVRLRRWRRRPRPGDARGAAPRRRPPGGSAYDAALERGVLQRARARDHGLAGPGRRAVLRVPPRDVHLTGRGQAREPHERVPAARRRAARGARPLARRRALPARRDHAPLAGALLQPVPRHHPGLVDHRGLRGRGARLRRDPASRRVAPRVGPRRARRRGRCVVSAQHGRRLETRGRPVTRRSQRARRGAAPGNGSHRAPGRARRADRGRHAAGSSRTRICGPSSTRAGGCRASSTSDPAARCSPGPRTSSRSTRTSR